MALTRNDLSIPMEGLKGTRKIDRMEWSSKQNYGSSGFFMVEGQRPR